MLSMVFFIIQRGILMSHIDYCLQTFQSLVGSYDCVGSLSGMSPVLIEGDSNSSTVIFLSSSTETGCLSYFKVCLSC